MYLRLCLHVEMSSFLLLSDQFLLLSDQFLLYITTKLDLDDRVELIATKNAFITLKDHKEHFANRPACRLINPSKSEIGKISKQILEKINRELVNYTAVNQWKNTSSVLEWYKQLTNKTGSAFICFDVVEFYPSISEELLQRALDFASRHLTITADEREVIINAKHSLLFNKGDPWEKRSSTTLFDVTMGSYDGAETCELVGCFLLAQLKQIQGINIGLYRDDGLAVMSQTPRKIEKAKKEICKVFAENGLRVTIEANKKVVDFLDVTLDLNTGKYKPYSNTANQITRPTSLETSQNRSTGGYLKYRATKKHSTRRHQNTKRHCGRAVTIIDSSLNHQHQERQHNSVHGDVM